MQRRTCSGWAVQKGAERRVLGLSAPSGCSCQAALLPPKCIGAPNSAEAGLRRAAAGMRSRKRGRSPERLPVYTFRSRGGRCCSSRCIRVRSFPLRSFCFSACFASLTACRCAPARCLARSAAARAAACASSRCLLASQPWRRVVGSCAALQSSAHRAHSIRRSYCASFAISSLFGFSPSGRSTWWVGGREGRAGGRGQ